jgi:hypothetical protein
MTTFRTRTTVLAATAALLGAAALTSTAAADPAPEGLTAVGLVGTDKLVRIDLAEGGKTRGGPRVSGLVGDTGLVGIDYRPKDGRLYGVGDEGGIYRIDPRNGQATKVSQLDVALVGESFGVDFNPMANALRIISDASQNLRHPFNPIDAGADPMTVADGPLNYAGVPATGVTGAAYTNNDADSAPPAGNGGAVAPTGTTLYDIDADLDQLVVQNPPNSGTLSDPKPLGVDTDRVVGFDIYSALSGASAVSNEAFAVLTVDGAPALYRIDLATGTASPLGALDKDVTDLAVNLAQ